MSEYEPITTLLRMSMTNVHGRRIPMVELGEGEFMRLCDEIDAVHTGLERENAELRERVAVLDNADENMHDGGHITDELRKFMDGADGYELWCPRHKKELTSIADRIDAEHEGIIKSVMNDALYYANDKDMAELGWVRLPLDADGVSINVGDEVADKVAEVDELAAPRKVTSLYLGNDGWWVYIGGIGRRPDRYRHHRAPTVEDVLTEMVAKLMERGELTNGGAQTISEYAKRLTLAGDAS